MLDDKQHLFRRPFDPLIVADRRVMAAIEKKHEDYIEKH